MKQQMPEYKTLKGVTQRFVKACENNVNNPNYDNRRINALHQRERNEWQIEDEFGRIRISRLKRKDKKSDYCISAIFYPIGYKVYKISATKYYRLKKLYLSDFITLWHLKEILKIKTE